MADSITVFFNKEKEDLIMLDILAAYVPASRKYLTELKEIIDKSILLLDEFGLDEEKLQKKEFDFFEGIRKSNIRMALENKNPKEISKTDLYLIQNTITKNYKIGRSKNPNNRLRQLNISSDQPLVLILSIKGYGDLEEEAHRIFSHIRLNSEWFKFDESIVDYFKKLQKNA